MNGHLIKYLLILALLAPANTAQAEAANAELEISEYTLNRMIRRLGTLSDAGLYQHLKSPLKQEFTHCDTVATLGCPESSAKALPASVKSGVRLMACIDGNDAVTIIPVGGPVSWSWWITRAYLTLTDGFMKFTAIVRSQVGDDLRFTKTTTRAELVLDTENGRAALDLGELKVPLLDRETGATVAVIDIARLYSLHVPLAERSFSVPLIDGTSRTITARVKGITPHYLNGRVLIDIDAEFRK